MDPAMQGMSSGMLSSIMQQNSAMAMNNGTQQRLFGMLPSMNYQSPFPLEANSLLQKLERIFPVSSLAGLFDWGNPNGLWAKLLRALGFKPGMGFEDVRGEMIAADGVRASHFVDGEAVAPSSTPAPDSNFDGEGNRIHR